MVSNEGSGGGTDPSAVEAALRRSGALVTSHPFEALDDLALDGCDRLVIATGDGGMGRAAARASHAGVPLGIVPSGTANDFAGFLRIPAELEEAARLAAAPDAATRRIDVARAGTVPFVNVAACGLSVAAAEKASPLKALLGATAYAVGAVRAGTAEDAEHVRVLVDGEERFAGEAWQVLVSGTGAFGNGSEIEAADPADGMLHVTVVHGGSRLALPLRAWGMHRGDLTEQDGVTSHAGCAVVVEGAAAWNVDGELCEQPDAGHFSLDGHVDVVVG